MRINLWGKTPQQNTPENRLSCGGKHHPIPPSSWRMGAVERLSPGWCPHPNVASVLVRAMLPLPRVWRGYYFLR